MVVQGRWCSAGRWVVVSRGWVVSEVGGGEQGRQMGQRRPVGGAALAGLAANSSRCAVPAPPSPAPPPRHPSLQHLIEVLAKARITDARMMEFFPQQVEVGVKEVGSAVEE